MIRITIGTEHRNINSLRDMEESWVNQQVNGRQHDGQAVCVQVSFELDHINFGLSTPACSRGGCLTRPLQPKEKEIIDLWDKHGLNQNGFSGGDVVAFFHQLRKIVD